MPDSFSNSILNGRPVPLEPEVAAQPTPAPDTSGDFTSSIASGRPVPIDVQAPAQQVSGGNIDLENKIRGTPAKELAEDDSFDPVNIIAQNEAMTNDPVVRKKLVDVARARHEKPFSLLKFATEVPGAVGGAVKSLAVGGAKALWSLAQAGAAGQAGDAYNALTPYAELATSVQTAAVQDANLARRAYRSVFEKAPTSDFDFERRLDTDAEARKQIDKTAQGEGEALHKYFDTDAKKILEAGGLSLNPRNVQDMSVATDLLNFIPAGAALKSAGKAFKLTEAGYQLVDSTGKVLADVAPKGTRTFKVVDAFNKIAAGAPELLGDAATKTGTAIRDTAAKIGKTLSPEAAGVAGAAIAGADALTSGGLTGLATGILAPKIGVKLGNALIETGKSLRGEVPAGPIFKTAAALINNPATRGAAHGLGLGLPADLAQIIASKAPLAEKLGDAALAAAPAGMAATGLAAADNEKETASALAGQAGVGALAGAGAAGAHALAPFFDIAEQGLGRDPVNDKPVASPAYGSDPALDAAHDAAIATLPPPVQNRLNALRELVRPKNAEIYVLPSDNFGGAVADFYRQKAESNGVVLDADKLKEIADHAAGEGGQKGLFVDNLNIGGQKKKVIFLNKDGGALGHETGHLFDSLFSPEERSSLRDAAYKAYSPEEQMAFKKEYDDALRQAAPDHPGLTQGQLLDEIIAETISAAISGLPIEKLGTPKPVARAIYQKVGDVLGVDAGKTDLGLRKDFGLIGTAENLVRAKATDDIPILGKVGDVDFSQVNIGQKPVNAQVPAPQLAPPASTGTPPAAPAPGLPNIRATRAQQDQFRGRPDNIPSDPVNEVKTAAAAVDAGNYTPKQKQAFVKIGATLTQGGSTPAPLEVVYNSVKTDKLKSGRKTRKGEQDSAYAAESRGAVPSSVRMQVQKVIVPNRVEVRSGGEVILHAFSLDKVIENIDKLIPDAVAKGAGGDIPYATDKGQLTPESAQQLIRDIQTYTRNQSNGYAGNGKSVVVPPTYFGQIPHENKGFTPVSLSPERAQFINVLLAGNYGAGAPPKTTRKTQRAVPANISARQLAEANQVPILPAAASKPGKNFFDAYGVDIAEFNPLRDKLFKKGVDIDNLGASNEVLKLSELDDVKVRNDLDFSRPSTDLIRAGFQPDPRKPARVTNEDVAAVADDYTKKAGIEYTPHTGYAALPPELGKKIADWFDTAQHEPNAPAVKESYNALIDQTKAQYDQMVAAGYKIEPFTGKGEPYSSSADMVADVKNNKHLYFLPTEQGTFGSGGIELPDNPMLHPSGVEVNGRQLLNNDLFRAVHDFFGHAKQGYEFGPRGEYNAFLAHSSMFTPDAIPALAAETLAQNAWVNFGKHLRREDGTIPARGDADFVPLNERPFAAQKNTIVPGEILSKVFTQDQTPAERRAAVKGSFAPRAPRAGATEWITSAALEDGNGKIHTGESHPSILMKHFGEGTDAGTFFERDGFMTNKGRFVSRDEAAKIAYDAGQVSDADAKMAAKGSGLDSADLTDRFTRRDAPIPKASFLPFQSKRPLPNSVGDETLNLVHFGQPGLREISPSKFGKSGLTSQSELAGEPRSFFYEKGRINKADPVTDRADMYEATVAGDRIYDGDKDALGYADMINRSKADSMLQKEGYVGIARTGGSGKKAYRQVELFQPVSVKPTDSVKGSLAPKRSGETAIRPAAKPTAPALTIRSRKDDDKN